MKKDNLYLDLETYCEVPIQNGTHAYAENAEIMLFAYALNDEPVKVWDCTSERLMPDDLAEYLADDRITLTAHNSHFDRTVLWHTGDRLPITRWRDTMVKALAHSLPGSLDALCEVLRVPVDKAKDKAGKQLVQLFCKPRPKHSALRRATKQTHPVEWERFVEYAALDIEAMRVIDAKLPAWNYQGSELALWHLDQTINDRGFAVDVELAKAAIEAVDRAQKQLADDAAEMTGGAVRAATQRDALLTHLLIKYGVNLPDMKKSTLERRINDESLPQAMRDLLAIRLQASTTSTSKYRTLVRATSSDHRLRGTLQFNGASRTGRWAGRLFQPQNLPRPSMKQHVIDQGIAALKAGCADLLFPNVMELTSSAIRGCIVAPAGKKIVVADLSNIEGRMLAWLSGESWKIRAFYEFDAGTGHDLYALAYAKSFNVSPQVVMDNKENGDGTMRQIGKVQELALGYQGGVGAFLTFAAAYNINLEEMADIAFAMLPPDIVQEAADAYIWTKKNKRPTFGLSERAWLTCDSFKRSWRYAHPNTVDWWHELEQGACRAIWSPTREVIRVRKVKMQKVGAWLRVTLPSGRHLCYPSPQVSDEGKLTYMGVDQYTRKWQRIGTYGGKLAENITQAASRDVLGHNAPHIEKSGYKIVLSVHDEYLTETEDRPEFNSPALAGLMATNPPWAEGLPLAAAGFEAYRYKKD